MSNLKVIRKTLVSGTASGYSFAETGAKFLVKNFSDNDCYVAVSSDEVNTKSVCVPSKKAFILLSNEFKPEGIDTLYILGEGEVEVRMLLTYVRVGDKKQTLLSGASYFMDITSDSEGGATVVANPTGEATADLTKIQVDDTIYAIPTGGDTTYNPFPAGWTTTGTIAQFCAAVNADATAVAGMAYLGELRCSDLPTGLANVEAVVEVIEGTGTTNKVIHIVITSGNVSPYRWEYTYWNNGTNVSGWKTWEVERTTNEYITQTYTPSTTGYQDFLDDLTNHRDIILNILSVKYAMKYIYNSAINQYIYGTANTEYDSTTMRLQTARIGIENGNIVVSTLNPQFKVVSANPGSATTNLTSLQVGSHNYKLDYLPLSGGAMTGDIDLKTNGGLTWGGGGQVLTVETANKFTFGNSNASIYIETNPSSAFKHKKGNNSYDILDTSNGLLLSGGTLTGALTTSGLINANNDIKLANNKSIRNADNGYSMISANGASTYVGDSSSSNAKVIFLQQAGVKVRYGSTEYDVLDANNTSANPTLAGTETSLTSLKLNGTNYAIAGGTQVTFVDWS